MMYEFNISSLAYYKMWIDTISSVDNYSKNTCFTFNTTSSEIYDMMI